MLHYLAKLIPCAHSCLGQIKPTDIMMGSSSARLLDRSARYKRDSNWNAMRDRGLQEPHPMPVKCWRTERPPEPRAGRRCRWEDTAATRRRTPP